MADETTTPATVPAVKPGAETSEHGMAKLHTYIGMAVVIAGGVLEVLQMATTVLPHAPPWMGLAIMALGKALLIAAQLGYTSSRTQIKVTALTTAQAAGELAK